MKKVNKVEKKSVIKSVIKKLKQHITGEYDEAKNCSKRTESEKNT